MSPHPISPSISHHHQSQITLNLISPQSQIHSIHIIFNPDHCQSTSIDINGDTGIDGGIGVGIGADIGIVVDIGIDGDIGVVIGGDIGVGINGDVNGVIDGDIGAGIDGVDIDGDGVDIDFQSFP